MPKSNNMRLVTIINLVSLSCHAAQFFPSNAASLIDAINTANSNNQEDVIDLHFKTITLTSPYSGQSGLPTILSDSNHALLIKDGVIQRRAGIHAQNFRLIDVGDSANLSLERVTLQNGRVNTGNLSGGAIHVRANAVITSIKNSTFAQNSADGNGGAINLSPTARIGVISNSTFRANTASIGGALFLNKSTVGEITDSTFKDNYATIFGGAVAVFNQTSLTKVANTSFTSNKSCAAGGAVSVLLNSNLNQLTSSTLARNSSPLGGALHVYSSTVSTITNSTFSNNSGAQGGALSLRNNARVDTIGNSTLADNVASKGGGAVFVSNNSLLARLNSTIVAIDRAKVGTDIQGSVLAESYNLVGNNHCTNITAGNPNLNKSKVGTPALPINPLLGALKDYGGPTLTRSLGRGSPAIDAGSNPLNLKFDQRGKNFVRTKNAGTDIGALEACDCTLGHEDIFSCPRNYRGYARSEP